jgi:hypothetical protein
MTLMVACSGHDDVLPKEGGRQTADASNEKTVLIYMVGRNDLSDALDKDLQEIRQGSKLIGEKNSLLVFVCRYNGTEKPWLARIRNGELTDSVSIADMGLTLTNPRGSDPEVMEHVISYAYSHYPSINNHYGLVLWGHANGWLVGDEVESRAYGIDMGEDSDNKDGRWINVNTMARVLSRLPHQKFIMGDCCNFMCLETLYELRKICDYVIGSPAEIPFNGAPYDQIMPDLFADGDFYSGIIDKYYSSTSGRLPLAVVKSNELEKLAQATRQALQTVKAAIGNGYADMSGLIHYYYTEVSTTYHPEYSIFYDAGDFIRAYTPDDVYQQWRQVLNEAVVEKRIATRWDTDKIWSRIYTDFEVTEEKFHGVSMFVPQDPSKGNYANNNRDVTQFDWYKVVWQ